MSWTVAEHYADGAGIAVGDGRQFDGDLRRIFAPTSDAPLGESAAVYVRRHEGELVSRIAYWSAVDAAGVRSLVHALRDRAHALELHVAGLEATTLIELTAFGTAVMLHWRYTHALRGRQRSRAR